MALHCTNPSCALTPLLMHTWGLLLHPCAFCLPWSLFTMAPTFSRLPDTITLGATATPLMGKHHLSCMRSSTFDRGAYRSLTKVFEVLQALGWVQRELHPSCCAWRAGPLLAADSRLPPHFPLPRPRSTLLLGAIIMYRGAGERRVRSTVGPPPVRLCPRQTCLRGPRS